MVVGAGWDRVVACVCVRVWSIFSLVLSCVVVSSLAGSGSLCCVSVFWFICGCYFVRVICPWCLILFFVIDCPFWLLLFFVFELGFWFCYLLLLIGRLFFIFDLVVYPWACPLCLNLAVVSDVAVGGCSAFFIVVVVMCSLVLFCELVFVLDRDVCVLLLFCAVCVLGVRSL